MLDHIAVLGAGTMGKGLARLFTSQGITVSLYDPYQKALDAAVKAAGTDGDEVLRLLHATDRLEEAVRKAGLVIEAGPEKLDTKREIYRSISPFIRGDAIVASNTSTLPLSELAHGQPFADRMIVAHFFHPADVIPLVELVRLPGTRAGVVEAVCELLLRCGKAPVVLKKDCPGFIANRLQAAVLREACFLLESGVADAEQIDRAMTEGPGMRWALNGPFEIADYGGLDIWERVSANLFPLLDKDEKPPEAVAALVRQGRLGAKSGGGFYDYGDRSMQERSAIQRENKLRGLCKWKQEMGD